MGYLDLKSLVVAGGKLDADSFVSVARRLDYRGYDVETSITSILTRLQDPSYQVCFLFESIVEKDGMVRLLARLRGNIQAKQVPIVVICTTPVLDAGKEYYEENVQFVISKLNEESLKEALLVTDSWIGFCNQFKEGREKFFRR
jgi:hypothetical protein